MNTLRGPTVVLFLALLASALLTGYALRSREQAISLQASAAAEGNARRQEIQELYSELYEAEGEVQDRSWQLSRELGQGPGDVPERGDVDPVLVNLLSEPNTPADQRIRDAFTRLIYLQGSRALTTASLDFARRSLAPKAVSPNQATIGALRLELEAAIAKRDRKKQMLSKLEEEAARLESLSSASGPDLASLLSVLNGASTLVSIICLVLTTRIGSRKTREEREKIRLESEKLRLETDKLRLENTDRELLAQERLLAVDKENYHRRFRPPGRMEEH